MLSPAFASILRSGRAEFNQRFAEAKRLYPNLSAEAFSEFLQSAVDPLLVDVARVNDDRIADVAQAAYDIALELVGQRLAGPSARDTTIDEGWRKVLPPLARHIALEPDKLLTAVTNAIHHVASVPGARPDQWVEEMVRFAPQCAEVEAVLRLGQICGWRAGLAHFRDDALALTDHFPDPMMLALFNADPSADWRDVKGRLAGSPWFDPSIRESPDPLRVVALAGAFRGFGGLFRKPPEVCYADGHFLVRSDSESWFLTADLFGATFHRRPSHEFVSKGNGSSLPRNVQIEKKRLLYGGKTLNLPVPGQITSAAANGTTLALTSSFTHSVALLALPHA